MNRLIADEIILLPNLLEMSDEQGFTCTGLTFDNAENMFYVGNIGKNAYDSEEECHSTIVVLDANFSTIIDEIDVGKIYPEMEDIQGLTIDDSDDTIWFCSFKENMIRHIDKFGRDIGGFEIITPTGIAYERKRDCIWVLTYSELLRVEKNGMIKNSIPVSVEGQDQIWLDEVNNQILMTAGTNYHGENYIYSIDLNSGNVEKIYALLDSYAIEGIVIINGEMYIANDGRYHKAKINTNQVNIYKVIQKEKSDG